jgi:hypothetical protein
MANTSDDPLARIRLRAAEMAAKTPISRGPRATTCEVLSGSGWKVITVDDALAMRGRGRWDGGRCVECHEPVRLHKEGTTGQAAHFEHLSRNAKCSRSDV